MAISDRDFALLQEEVKCLRQKLSNTVGTSGGYTDVLTSPGSSVYPNSYTENCDCVNVVAEEPNATLGSCSTGDDATSDNNLGDMANSAVNTPVGGLFAFDAHNGVFYLPPGSSTYQNRNTGLADTTLEHGCKDVWWYRKKSPNENYTILWIVGHAKVMRSATAGRSGWTAMTPSPPTGTTINNVVFKQIISDPYRQNVFWILAIDNSNQKTWVVSTVDDGVNWNWLDLTNYNSVAHRVGIWMAIGGPSGALLWVTTWGDDQLRVLKLNADNPPTISAEYSMGSATLWDVENFFEILSPAIAIDSNKVYLYGRATNPQNLGLGHIISSSNEGVSWSIVENTWADDWCGSIKIGLNDDVYAVRNVRSTATEPPGPYLIGSIVAATGGSPSDAVYTKILDQYLFDNYGGSLTPLYRATVGIDGNGLPTIAGRAVIYNDYIFWPGDWARYMPQLGAGLISGYGVMLVNPVGSGTPSGSSFNLVRDYFSTNEFLMFARGNAFHNSGFAWRSISASWTVVYDLPGSYPNDSEPIDCLTIDSTNALCVYKDYLTGTLVASVLSMNVQDPIEDSTFDLQSTTDSGDSVNNANYGYMLPMGGGVYALFYDDSLSRLAVLSVSSLTATFLGQYDLVIAAIQACTKIDSTRIGVVYIDNYSYMYATVHTNGTVDSPVLIYTTELYPGLSTSEAGISYVSGKIVVSYVDDSGDLRLASVSL